METLSEWPHLADALIIGMVAGVAFLVTAYEIIAASADWFDEN